jgi:hypothetical protein
MTCTGANGDEFQKREMLLILHDSFDSILLALGFTLAVINKYH